jgi:hypothetical protein
MLICVRNFVKKPIPFTFMPFTNTVKQRDANPEIINIMVK